MAAGDFSMDNWTTQLRKGLLELCMVNLLAEDEIYGYDLVKRLSSIPGLMVSEGTVYPLLSRMRKSGMVESRLVESESGPARRYYALSQQGKASLALMNQHWGNLIHGLSEIVGESKDANVDR
ncbi:MAG: PadR family transcriptional regulator [Planctomycetia bacterium]|jgi:PadR family transcriptional regulator PadR